MTILLDGTEDIIHRYQLAVAWILVERYDCLILDALNSAHTIYLNGGFTSNEALLDEHIRRYFNRWPGVFIPTTQLYPLEDPDGYCDPTIYYDTVIRKRDPQSVSGGI